MLSGRSFNNSRVAQWKRAGPITQRSEDRNFALLCFLFFYQFLLYAIYKTKNKS